MRSAMVACVMLVALGNAARCQSGLSADTSMYRTPMVAPSPLETIGRIQQLELQRQQIEMQKMQIEQQRLQMQQAEQLQQRQLEFERRQAELDRLKQARTKAKKSSP